MAQIQFAIKPRYSFAYNALPGAITVQDLPVDPDLLHRKIYADVRQPSGYQRIVAFTLDFLLTSVSQGTIAQRACDSTVAIGNGERAYGFGATFGLSSGTPRQTSDGLQTTVANSGSGSEVREVAPITLRIKCDTIRLTVTEWSSAATQDGEIVLACLSSYHRF